MVLIGVMVLVETDKMNLKRLSDFTVNFSDLLFHLPRKPQLSFWNPLFEISSFKSVKC